MKSNYLIAILFVFVISSCSGKSGTGGRTSLYFEPDDYYSDDIYEETENPIIELEELKEENEELKSKIEELQEKLDNISDEVSKAKSNLEDAEYHVYGALDDLNTNLNNIEDECDYEIY